MKLFFACVVFGVIQLVFLENSPLFQQFATGSAQFTSDVYKQLKELNKGDNFLFCPLSALIILGLTQTAARGITAQQLSNGLHLPEDRTVVEQTFQQLLPTLKGNEEYTLTSVNKIYVRNGYKIKEEYKNIAQNFFGSEIQNINFEEKNAAAAEMNGWVASKTHNKIRDLINPLKLSKSSLLILINALYFKGSWVYTFDEENTLKQKFFTTSDNHIEIDMMKTTQYFNYHSSSTLDAQFLEMPYKGDDVSMVVVLPNQVEGLSALENSIEAVLNTKLDLNVEVHLQLPKFKQETNVELKKILQNLGITNPFEDSADFSGFGEPGQQSIKISDVVQKSVIEVNEQGTVAAAATAVLAVDGFSLIQKPRPKQFIADHPFIYFIKSPAGVMFIGRYVK